MYRQEAAQSRIKGFSNPVTIKGSLAVHVMLVGIFLVAAGLITFGIFTDYTRRSVVTGYLHPAAGSVGITALTTGRLLLDVKNGDTVTEGQRLARIKGLNSDASGRSLLELEISALKAAKDLSTQRMELTQSRIEPLETQAQLALAQHADKIAFAGSLVTSRQNQLALVAESYERNKSLEEKGLLVKSVLVQVQQQFITAQQDLFDAKAQVDTLKAQTKQLELDWQTRKVELLQSIGNLKRELHDIEGQISSFEAKREAGLFSPIAGNITLSNAQNGDVVNAGAALLEIIPQSSDLQAVLLAPSSAVGFVKPNDTVQLRYAAFPFREHGVFTGTVVQMDKTAQLPSALYAPIAVVEPVYRIIVDIEQFPLSKKNKPLRLTSGMTMEASIIIDQKPLLFWLLDPIL